MSEDFSFGKERLCLWRVIVPLFAASPRHYIYRLLSNFFYGCGLCATIGFMNFGQPKKSKARTSELTPYALKSKFSVNLLPSFLNAAVYLVIRSLAVSRSELFKFIFRRSINQGILNSLKT